MAKTKDKIKRLLLNFDKEEQEIEKRKARTREALRNLQKATRDK